MPPTSDVDLRVVPFAAAHTDGLTALFTSQSNGCFCQFWSYLEDDLSWQGRCNVSPDQNRQALKDEVDRGELIGVVALRDAEVVGWLRLRPDEEMRPKLSRRRLYRDLACLKTDREGTWLVACTLVHPRERGRGLAHHLVEVGIEVARVHGARRLEALVRRPRDPRARDDELWLGPESCFVERGFTRVDDGPDAYPVYRKSLV